MKQSISKIVDFANFNSIDFDAMTGFEYKFCTFYAFLALREDRL